MNNDRLDFETKMKDTIDSLTDVKDSYKLKDGVKEMAVRKIANEINGNKRKKFGFIPAFATTLAVLALSVSVSVLAFPEVASKYASSLPIVKELNEKESKISNLEEQINELQIQVKEISKEEIKEVITSENDNEALNIQLQSLAVNFVKSMYRGEYTSAAEFCTEEFGKEVVQNPEYIIMRKENAVVFTQITNIAKLEDGTYLVFLRLNDSDETEADYQIDFEIIQKDGKFLISFAGMNA